MQADPHSDHWQLQEAKQRFSEVIRAVELSGTQFVTRHGDEVAAIVPIQSYRHEHDPDDDFVSHLLSAPVVDDEVASVFDEIEARRKQDLPREIDLGESR